MQALKVVSEISEAGAARLAAVGHSVWQGQLIWGWRKTSSNRVGGMWTRSEIGQFTQPGAVDALR